MNFQRSPNLLFNVQISLMKCHVLVFSHPSKLRRPSSRCIRRHSRCLLSPCGSSSPRWWNCSVAESRWSWQVSESRTTKSKPLFRALDMVLTGRGVPANEALQWGLVNRVVQPGKGLSSSMIFEKMSLHFSRCYHISNH